MSDTPRSNNYDWSFHLLFAEAQKMERELNAANSKIELLMSANADVARIADERDAAENRIPLLIAERDTARLQADQNYKLRDEFQLLLGTDKIEEGIEAVKELKRRIKRLEEAGDALANHHLLVVTTYDKAKTHVSDWIKAKEAKP